MGSDNNGFMPGYTMTPGGVPNRNPYYDGGQPGMMQRGAPAQTQGYYNQQPRPDMSFQNFANQQGQQRPPDKFLICKMIDDPDKIMPADVPSNGEPAFFVMRDFSRVYGRAVNSRGTIDDVPYEPVKQQTPEDIQQTKDQEFRDSVSAQLANIQNILTNLMAMPFANSNSSNTQALKAPEDSEEPKNKRGGKQ